MSVRVTVWNENIHEKELPQMRDIYPEGLHGCIAGFLTGAGYAARTAVLQQPECGLAPSVLDETDVLIWWGHKAHEAVSDEAAARVCRRVHEGMGLIVLHSGYSSKVMRRLLGVEGVRVKWRDQGEKEILWTALPGHPIAEGLEDEKIIIPREEMYGEPFGVPTPDELVFIGWFQGGEVFRSGCCWHRGRGKLFYFQPGHELFPTYHIPAVQKILINAVKWAAPTQSAPSVVGEVKPVVPIDGPGQKQQLLLNENPSG